MCVCACAWNKLIQSFSHWIRIKRREKTRVIEPPCKRSGREGSPSPILVSTCALWMQLAVAVAIDFLRCCWRFNDPAMCRANFRLDFYWIFCVRVCDRWNHCSMHAVNVDRWWWPTNRSTSVFFSVSRRSGERSFIAAKKSLDPTLAALRD